MAERYARVREFDPEKHCANFTRGYVGFDSRIAREFLLHDWRPSGFNYVACTYCRLQMRVLAIRTDGQIA